MKKKVLSLGIVAILVTMLVLLTGCGNSENSNKNSEENNEQVNATSSDNNSESEKGLTVGDYTIKYGYYKDNNVTVIKINEDGTLTRGGVEYTYTVENDQIITSLKGFTYRVTSDTTLVEVYKGNEQTTLNYYQD